MFPPIRQTLFFCVAVCTLLTGCGGGGGGGSQINQAQSAPQLSAAAQLGEKIFHDPSLSASGSMSCATCHVPDHAHAGADGLAAPLGGTNLNVPGFRNAPSLRYLEKNPSFFFDGEGTPSGGFDRDGRANDLIVQAQRPFLAAHEMANTSATDVVDKLSRAAYVEEFRKQFGVGILQSPDDAFDRIRFALARYQKEDADFHPYDSKYDFFLAGKATLSDQELRGLALYNNPTKGNCAACHPSGKGADGSPPLFTDFTYDNLGVPRNAVIAANADAAYFDLGLCGPFRTDPGDRSDLCGAFKVPTLRNIALTAPYFHNGKFETLAEVVAFYVRRDTNPEEWYPIGASGVEKFNDLPPDFQANVNITEVPYNRKPGEAPALNAQEIADVVAFLNTLSDGYKP
jgi:cytochrome c peroxidase